MVLITGMPRSGTTWMHDIILSGALDSTLNYTGRLHKLYNGPVKPQNSPCLYTSTRHPQYDQIRTSEPTPHSIFNSESEFEHRCSQLKNNLSINYSGGPELLIKDLQAPFGNVDLNQLTAVIICLRQTKSWIKSASRHSVTPTQVSRPRSELRQHGARGDYITYAEAYQKLLKEIAQTISREKLVEFNFDSPESGFLQIQKVFGFSSDFMSYLRADFKGSRWK